MQSLRWDFRAALLQAAETLPRRDETHFFSKKTSAECHGSTCTRMTRRCEFLHTRGGTLSRFGSGKSVQTGLDKFAVGSCTSFCRRKRCNSVKTERSVDVNLSSSRWSDMSEQGVDVNLLHSHWSGTSVGLCNCLLFPLHSSVTVSVLRLRLDCDFHLRNFVFVKGMHSSCPVSVLPWQ